MLTRSQLARSSEPDNKLKIIEVNLRDYISRKTSPRQLYLKLDNGQRGNMTIDDLQQGISVRTKYGDDGDDQSINIPITHDEAAALHRKYHNSKTGKFDYNSFMKLCEASDLPRSMPEKPAVDYFEEPSQQTPTKGSGSGSGGLFETIKTPMQS